MLPSFFAVASGSRLTFAFAWHHFETFYCNPCQTVWYTKQRLNKRLGAAVQDVSLIVEQKDMQGFLFGPRYTGWMGWLGQGALGSSTWSLRDPTARSFFWQCGTSSLACSHFIQAPCCLVATALLVLSSFAEAHTSSSTSLAFSSCSQTWTRLALGSQDQFCFVPLFQGCSCVSVSGCWAAPAATYLPTYLTT